MKTLRMCLWALMACPVWAPGLAAQAVLLVDTLPASSWEPYPEKYMEYVKQPPGIFWDIDEVQSLPDSVWRPLGQHYGAHFGFSNAGYWLRFQVRNDHDAPLTVLLECSNPNLDTLDYYCISPDQSERSNTSGILTPPDWRDVNYHNLAFSWPLPANETNTVYLYARSLYYPANFSFSVGAKEHWDLRTKLIEIGAIILFFAFILVYLSTLAVLFSIVGDRYLWLFYLYVLFTALFMANDLGIWYWIWPGLDYRIWMPLAINLSVVCGLLFVRYYFKTHRRYRYLDWVLLLISAVALATSGLSLLLYQRPEVFIALNRLLVINLLAACGVVAALVAYTFFRHRDKERFWFAVGFAPHGIATALTCLHQLGFSHPLLSVLLFASPFNVNLNTPWLLLGAILWELLIVSVLFILRHVKDFYESSNRLLVERRNALVLGVETERKRVAQEIHDGIGVLLSSTKMKLAALRERMKTHPDWHQETGDLLNTLDLAHEEMRELAYNLMPKSLERLGLAQAIEGMVSRLRRNHPEVQWHFYSNFQNGHLDELTKINLFRIAQEMLHNVMQHARATEAHLQLLRQDKQIVLSVEDNGQGFLPKAHSLRTGIGLSNIRYRAEDVLKGNVNIESSPGKGTFIAVVVPG